MKHKDEGNITLFSVLCIGIAAAMQVFITPDLFGTRIRIALADIFVPGMAVICIFFVRNIQQKIKKRPVRMLATWLFALSILLIVSALNGFLQMGYFMPWAFINKLLGWFILNVYLVLGIIAALELSPRQKHSFFQVLLLAASLIAVIDFYPFLYAAISSESYWRPVGFAENPNAYALLLSVIILCVIPFGKTKPVISKNIDTFLVGWLLSWVVITGSRSAWLGMIFGFFVLVFSKNVNFGKILSITLFCTFFVFLLGNLDVIGGYFIQESSSSKIENPVYILRPNLLFDSGISHRLNDVKVALGLWFERPFLGIGIGGFLDHQIDVGGRSTIHSTPLWLLVETGLVGFIAFSCFFIYLVRCFFDALRISSSNSRSSHVIGLAVLTCFAASSVGMESMYQRHIWFFVGWAFASMLRSNDGHAHHEYQH